MRAEPEVLWLLTSVSTPFIWQEHLIENEVSILRRVKHPNIIMLVEEMETATELFLVMELVKVRGWTGSTGVKCHVGLQLVTKYATAPSVIHTHQFHVWPFLHLLWADVTAESWDWTADISMHPFYPTGWRSLRCNYFFNQVHRERWKCHGVQPSQCPQISAWPQHCTQRYQAGEPPSMFRISAISFSTRASWL